ncbi:MAG: peptide chain release factor N(5)-glutamine methyltransferase [Proteobacteria bacterium]|nr:peptide chain release factor N(5)-glutamine methyltransferase [Pseudomonadota bacterium]
MKDAEIWTPPKLVQWISNDFLKRGFPPPQRLEAEHLVSHALNISRLDIYLQFDRPCTDEEKRVVRSLVRRRYNREPLAYILGNCEFWSLSLEVGPGVLIPRRDTEVLVETIGKFFPAEAHDPSICILEFGTGTAALPLALATDREDLFIVSVDNSPSALEFASRNVARYRQETEVNSSRIVLVRGNKFEALRHRPTFDFLISNPPYIPEDEISSLQDEVSLWEPIDALAGGKDGLDFFAFLKESAAGLLKPNGFLIFEHGYDQRASIRKLMDRSDRLEFKAGIKDYSGHDRVLVYQKVSD